MPRSECVLAKCGATRAKCKGLTFHRLPKTGKTDQWRNNLLKIIDKPQSVVENATICSRHFEDSCFTFVGQRDGRRTLSEGSLPTKYLPEKSAEILAAIQEEIRMRDESRASRHYTSIQDVHEDASSVTYPWVVLQKTDDILHMALIHNNTISISVMIDKELSATVTALGIPAPNMSGKLDCKTLTEFLEQLSNCKICSGCTEKHLQKYATLPTSKSKYYRNTTCFYNGAHMSYNSIVRSTNCIILMEKQHLQQCKNCKYTKKLLRRKHLRKIKRNLHPISKHASIKQMTKSRLRNAYKILRKTNANSIKKLQAFRYSLKNDAVTVEPNMHNNLLKAIDAGNINSALTKMFWKEQVKAFTRKEKGMRWHPAMIRLAILLHSRGPATYRVLRDTGILKLPGTSTLRDYTNVITPRPGINPDVMSRIKEKHQHLEDKQRFIVLQHDEMSIKSDLVYDIKTKKVVGFINTNDWTFDSDNKLASHVLVYFIVGINSTISESVAYYPTTTATCDLIYETFWDVVGHLETVCGLHVIASTSDKAAPNMSMYKLHGHSKSEPCHKTINLFAPDRHIYFFSDVPHLVKTVRNNLSNSGKGKRLLWNNGKFLTWEHITKIYRVDQTNQLRRTKLSTEHINLTPHSIMNVKLAVQVLSWSVGNVLRAYGGEACSETATFVLLMDRFFDCLNSRSLQEGHRKRKPDLEPYTSVNDPRFDFLIHDFLGYFNQWKTSVDTRQGTFTKSARNQMFLTKQSYDGLRMTVNAFVECTKYLLGCGVEFVLSNKFCQDPLESHFGRHRAAGGRGDNPNLWTFGHQENKIAVQREMALLIQPRGNVQGKRKVPTISDSPLKKLKHSHT